MSTIKVADLQHTSNSNDSISIASNSSVALKHSGNQKLITTANGVDITGACTATSFTGDGANLTGVPAPSTYNAANLTGTLPAIDGSNLTNVGGGSLEFISKTTVSSSVSYVDITGFDYGYIYKLVLKHVVFSGGGGQYPEFKPFVNGATSPITNSACIYAQVTRQGTSGGSGSGYTAWQFYDGAGYFSGSDPFECSVEFSTDYRPHFRGFSQSCLLYTSPSPRDQRGSGLAACG